MFATFENSWELVKASAGVLKAEKSLLVFPAISTVALVVVIATFLVPTALLNPGVFSDEGGVSPFAAVLAFVFYFVQYAVILFFNTALVGAAMIRLEGGDPNVQDGLRIARARIGSILGYALVAASVGMILRAIRERSGMLGNIVAGLFGLAWSLATFLVVPVIVVHGGGPIEAVKKSAAVLKRTWGEQIVGNYGIGMIFLVVYAAIGITGFGAFALVSQAGVGALTFLVIGLVVIAFAIAALVQAALSGIYAAALYRHATGQNVSIGFPDHLLEQAFVAK